MTKLKCGDVIRDFTQTDPSMKNIWRYGGKIYVLYRVLSSSKNVVRTIRMASPNHTDRTEYKDFSLSTVKKVSQTIGIFEAR